MNQANPRSRRCRTGSSGSLSSTIKHPLYRPHTLEDFDLCSWAVNPQCVLETAGLQATSQS